MLVQTFILKYNLLVFNIMCSDQVNCIGIGELKLIFLYKSSFVNFFSTSMKFYRNFKDYTDNT